ncbi:hypothetical protein Tco_1028286 [Tanacetum coccineum]|uniref:Uncharacterized protein n=1 Tax=Tanacetum coccineum TaxID=301880 RepID=A0ABQ5G1J4_9ASTR
MSYYYSCPGYEVGESSAAGTARQVGPATARADLYGFVDMLDATPGRQTSRKLGYGITDTWDDLPSDGGGGQLSRATWHRSMDACDRYVPREISLRLDHAQQSEKITDWQAADRRRQTVISDLLKSKTIEAETIFVRH